MVEQDKKREISQEQAMGLLQNERAKLNSLQERFNQFRVSLEETFKARDALKNIQKANSQESIMIPLGAGVYTTGTLSDNQKVYITLGGGIIKSDSIPVTLKQLEIRQGEAEQELTKLQKQLEETMGNINSLSHALQRVQKPPTQ
ncbi:prefoldin subunit alpha [Candidatus Micrarchaeota archaeon]|nr:prefoldin subunit alpha [Candidatus Micrarchaeota archaeon]MBU1929926.1 prefoldin subunit alpha [Candidatus Micrarchaeota archaeon]